MLVVGINGLLKDLGIKSLWERFREKMKEIGKELKGNRINHNMAVNRPMDMMIRETKQINGESMDVESKPGSEKSLKAYVEGIPAERQNSTQQGLR